MIIRNATETQKGAVEGLFQFLPEDTQDIKEIEFVELIDTAVAGAIVSGQSRTSEGRIELLSSLEGAELIRVLLHEIGHFAFEKRLYKLLTWIFSELFAEAYTETWLEKLE